jgi:hypothetical protein
MIILVYYLLDGLKKGNVDSIIKNYFIIAIFGVLLFSAVSVVLPASTNFFLGRFQEIKENPKDDETNTLMYRFARTGDVFDKMDVNKSLWGYGPVTEAQVPWIVVVDAATADLVWSGVVFRWGFLGMFLFVCLYIVSLNYAYKIFFQTEGDLSLIALALFLVVFAQLIEGFTSWTFLSPSRYALSLWHFGLLSGLYQGMKNKINSNAETE